MSRYRIVEYKIPCQHIREYPRALAHTQDDVLYLAVKQYIPLDNPDPQPGDVTIVGAHANGFPKELYEPLWDDLIAVSRDHGFRIRSIWISDVAHQGQSGILNEELLGNDPAWWDHSRDLLHLINIKREQMPRPIIGIGHSMGGAQLANLSFFHPRLFTTLILLDPVIQKHTAELKEGAQERNPNISQLSTFRRDVWPSRQNAAESFLKSPFYRAWDPRVFSRWVEFGLREMPTPSHSSTSSGPTSQVALRTPVSQEVFTFLRPNYTPSAPNIRTTHPDLDPAQPHTSPFYRPEGPACFWNIQHLRPPTLYIFGSTSTTSTAEMNQEKLERTGTGVGGSGGLKAGRVKGITFDGVGHLIAMEAVMKTAVTSAEWIGAEMRRWAEEEAQWQREWRDARSLREKQDLDQQWKDAMGGPPKRPPKAEPKL